MAEQTVTMKTNHWYGDDHIEINFPAEWNVDTRLMAGHDATPLTQEEIKARIRSPIGSRCLSEIAEGKETAVIVFSDLTRADDPKEVLPGILEELHHNIYDHFEEMGVTPRGTPVEINREYATADVKIGIGGIIAHSFAGFGGGAKGVFPGVASLRAIETNHRRVDEERARGRAGYGVMADNVIRFDIEDAVRIAGLDFKVDMVYNVDRRPLGVFAGDFVKEHRAGIEYAKEVLTTEPVQEADIVVANSYPGEMGKASWAPKASLREDGTAVIIHNYVQGAVHHNIYGQFGIDYGGHLNRNQGRAPTASPFPKAGKVMVVNRYHSKRDMNPSIIWVKEWSEALEMLKGEHGASAKVAVYPYCAIQMPPFPPGY
jgi:nickel-dependent lactate racemase